MRPGLIYEERLKDPTTAFAKFLEAFSLAPAREITREDPGAPGRPASRAAGTSSPRPTSKPSTATTDPLEITDLRLSAGTVLAQIGRVDEAIKQLADVYDAEPDNMRAAQALEPLYRQTGRFADVLEIYRKRQELEENPEVRKQLAYHIAALTENELKKPAEAIDCYTQIIADWGDDEVDAYRALERLNQDLGKLLGSRRRAAASHRSRAELGRGAGVAQVPACARQAGAPRGHCRGGRPVPRDPACSCPSTTVRADSSRRCSTTRSTARPRPRSSSRCTRRTGQWENLIRALEVLVVGADSPEEKLRLLTKIGQVAAGPLDNAGRSFDAHMRALREMPSHADTVAQLEVLAIEQDRFDELVKLVVELAANETDPVLARSLYLKAAEHYATQLGDMDGAVGCYNKILESDPDRRRGAGVARDAVSRARALERAARRAAPQGRAHVGSGPQGSAAGADGRGAPARSSARRRRPSRATARSSRSTRPARVRSPRSTRCTSARPCGPSSPTTSAVSSTWRKTRQQQTAYMLRLAALREHRMGAVEAAIEIYREVLSRDPSNAGGAQRARALDAEARARAGHRRDPRAALRRRRPSIAS